ncbi:MAG: hypothetical protein ABFS18_14715 [Thermodesulfobacteriota bacterium]
MRTVIFFLVVLLTGMASSAYGSPTAKLTVKVVDEQGVPIQGAKTYISFAKPNYSGIGVADILKKGMSDKEGLFSSKSSTMNYIGVSAKKEGYYHSDVSYEFTSRSKLLRRWEPWNPTVEVVLKKKRNPVPMYMKGTGWIQVPATGTSVGYDLEKGDWVTPYGKGITKDFVFIFSSDIKAYREYDLKMTLGFSNELDGIKKYLFNKEDQSYFKWPFKAPANGYDGELVKTIHKIPGKTETNINREAKYIFRVRTITDKEGNIISANYGKVASEFELSPEGSECMIRFSYYFDPEGTRNLEEDPEKNLFKNK